MDLYTGKVPIEIIPPIKYSDLWHISKCLNIERGIGNSINLLVNGEWEKFMEENPQKYKKYNGKFKRNVIFYTGKGDGESIELKSFGTDVGWNEGSVLSNNDVKKIFECISKIHSLDERIEKKRSTFEYLKDPVSLELFNQPYIASDGYTYSYTTLYKIFKANETPLSPITRNPLVKLNGKLGIPNILISDLVSKFNEDKIDIMIGGDNNNLKYIKYKTKYLQLKNK